MARPQKWYQALIDWAFVHVGVPVLVALMRLFYATMRWRVEGRENLAPFWDEGRPVIIAFWHGRLGFMPGLWERKGNAHVLIGTHRNGELIARAIAPFGIGAVRGSPRKGGKEALQQMTEAFSPAAGKPWGSRPTGRMVRAMNRSPAWRTSRANSASPSCGSRRPLGPPYARRRGISS